MNKALASDWMDRAYKLARLDGPYLVKNIAICLASAYRQGWSASRKEEVMNAPAACAILRTIYREALRTGSWQVPVDIQERICQMQRDGEI